MKKPLCILLAVVLVFTATVAAACTPDETPAPGSDVFEADDEMRLVIAYDEPEEKVLPLSGLSRNIGLMELFDECGIEYTAADGFLYSVEDLSPDGTNGEYIYIYTSVVSDFDTSANAEEIEYDGVTLVSSGVGAAEMTIEAGAVVYIGTIIYG